MPSSAIKAIFTKTFVAISLINMLGLAGYYAIFVVSTQFLSEVFHASTAVAGLATGIIVIGCLVGRFFTGSIVHSAGYRRVLFCGVLLYLLTNAAYFFADTLALIFLVRFVSGVAVGIVGTVTGTIVAVVVPTQFHGRGIAYFSMSTALALCFGPFIGIALVDSLGYEGIFAIGTAMEEEFIARAYTDCVKISIDYGVMEKTDKAWLYPARFGWSDVGTWESLYGCIGAKDGNGNIYNTAKALTEGCSDTVMYSDTKDKLIAVKGLENYVVIDTGKALLICPKDDRKLKEFTARLSMPGFENYR